jgi:hypothetical protein
MVISGRCLTPIWQAMIRELDTLVNGPSVDVWQISNTVSSVELFEGRMSAFLG